MRAASSKTRSVAAENWLELLEGVTLPKGDQGLLHGQMQCLPAQVLAPASCALLLHVELERKCSNTAVRPFNVAVIAMHTTPHVAQ